MGTISIGIGHDNDFVIVSILNREVCSHTRTDGINHRVDFFIFEDIRHLGFSCIDNLTTKRQDCLELAVTALFGRTTRQSPPRLDRARFLAGFLDWAGVNFPDSKPLSFLFFLPFRLSSRALRAASRASRALIALRMRLEANSPFSIRKKVNLSATMPSTTGRARGLPSLSLVCPQTGGVLQEPR